MLIRPMLESLSSQGRELVLASARRCYPRGVALFREGEDADAMFVIVSGRAAVRVGSADGDEVILRILGPGAAVGAEVALDGAARTRRADVVAVEPVEAVRLGTDRIAALRSAGPAFDRYLLTMLADDLGRLSNHLLEMLVAPAPVRVLRRVLALADESGATVVRLTQHELAQATGTTRPTVNETLRRAAAEGAVVLGRGHVEVVDRERLAALSSGRQTG